MTTCGVQGCGKQARARGWCWAHYQRWRDHGDVDYQPPSWEQRFWGKVDKSGECWEWRGALSRAGYGAFGRTRGTTIAHRIAYELVKGSIPKNFTLDHLCRNRRCVNPDHLEPVTLSVNVKRGGNTIKTECPRGHPYDEANTYVLGARRFCRACNLIRQYEYKRRKELL